MHPSPSLAFVSLALIATFASAATVDKRAVTLPPVNGQADYQLGGAYTPDATVTIVTRDRTASPATGKYNICYLNAFQTQAEDETWWKSEFQPSCHQVTVT